MNQLIYKPLMKTESRFAQILHKWGYAWACGITYGLWCSKSAFSHVTSQDTLLYSLLWWHTYHPYRYLVLIAIPSTASLLNHQCRGVIARVWLLGWWWNELTNGNKLNCKTSEWQMSWQEHARCYQKFSIFRAVLYWNTKLETKIIL